MILTSPSPRRLGGRLLTACSLALLLALSACGGSDDSAATSPSDGEQTPTTCQQSHCAPAP